MNPALELAEQYAAALVAYEEAFLRYRLLDKKVTTDRQADALAMSETRGAHIVAEAKLKIALSR